jgi:hypothetical protein
MASIKNFIFYWLVVLVIFVYCAITLTILMPLCFIFYNKSFSWSAEYEAELASTEMLKLTTTMTEMIYKYWRMK